MGFFDDVFGGDIFDFNGDGETTWDEEALGFMILDEISKENSEDNWDSDDFSEYF